MSAPVRYEFDSVFAIEKSSKPEPPKIDVITAESQAEAAYQDGFEKGRAAAVEDQSAKVGETLDRLIANLPGVEQRARQMTEAMHAEAARIGYAFAQKLARKLLEREPATEIDALLQDVLGELQNVPHLVIRVHESMSEELSERANDIARVKGFEGRIIVMGEPDIALGDGRIEWADGGVVRDMEKIETALNDAVEQFCARHDPAGNGEASL